MNRPIAIFICAGTLVLLSACNLINDDGDTESGISGDGSSAGDKQASVGDGSDSSWASATCRIVDGKTEWRWSDDSNSFSIDDPTSWSTSSSVDITLINLSSCAIDSTTKIAYTTKDWLCVDDYVKVNGTGCLIDDISGGDLDEGDAGISGDGVILGEEQASVGSGSGSAWNSAKCMVVEGNTVWKFRAKHRFQIGTPSNWEPDIEISVIQLPDCEITNCTTDDCPESSKIAYTTKDWLCADDHVKINGNSCLITDISNP